MISKSPAAVHLPGDIHDLWILSRRPIQQSRLPPLHKKPTRDRDILRQDGLHAQPRQSPQPRQRSQVIRRRIAQRRRVGRAVKHQRQITKREMLAIVQLQLQLEPAQVAPEFLPRPLLLCLQLCLAEVYKRSVQALLHDRPEHLAVKIDPAHETLVVEHGLRRGRTAQRMSDDRDAIERKRPVVCVESGREDDSGIVVQSVQGEGDISDACFQRERNVAGDVACHRDNLAVGEFDRAGIVRMVQRDHHEAVTGHLFEEVGVDQPGAAQPGRKQDDRRFIGDIVAMRRRRRRSRRSIRCQLEHVQRPVGQAQFLTGSMGNPRRDVRCMSHLAAVDGRKRADHDGAGIVLAAEGVGSSGVDELGGFGLYLTGARGAR